MTGPTGIGPGTGTVNQRAVEPPQAPLIGAINMIEKALSEQDGLLDNLESRLSFFLLPECPTPPSEKPAQCPQASELANRLRAYVDIIDSRNDRLTRIISRLDA